MANGSDEKTVIIRLDIIVYIELYLSFRFILNKAIIQYCTGVKLDNSFFLFIRGTVVAYVVEVYKLKKYSTDFTK